MQAAELAGNLNQQQVDPHLEEAIENSWSKIAPFWPLKNLVAVNPVSGFGDLAFEDALKQANAYFQTQKMPKAMDEINRQSIKWLQAFFDEGQSTIKMPMRHLGLLKSTLSLLRFDKKLHQNKPDCQQWFEVSFETPEALMAKMLVYLGIEKQDQATFLTLMLTTLPGWAAHVQYRTSWSAQKDEKHPVTQSEYLAFRLILTCLIWPEAKALLSFHQDALKKADTNDVYQKILASEKSYQAHLLEKLNNADSKKAEKTPKAQLVFCIDVRSEPFRRALEAQGDYETFGLAGFFGIPVSVENSVTGESHACCPVLLKPEHHVVEQPNACQVSSEKRHKKLQGVKQLYQSLKYSFATPFSLVETMGFASGIWMSLKSFAPKTAMAVQTAFKKTFMDEDSVTPDIQSIPLENQITYSAQALKLMGFTDRFAPLVLLCGHGSSTQNNAHASALDCGACGGRHGASNARILAYILNDHQIRNGLAKNHNIYIPEETLFLGAKHNTTTDEVEVYDQKAPENFSEKIISLKEDLKSAGHENALWRSKNLGVKKTPEKARKATTLRSKDWAQVRPEWGLAKNAAFVVGPRHLTQAVDLEGRSFLHSYDWEQDEDGALLTTILTAPVVVAHWINAQYLFSTLDNVAFGAGSKVTKNITGKIGIMQGNASDLMHGLPLQSVFSSDKEAYHQLTRLTVVVHAPQSKVESIIERQPILEKLFGNGWVHLICDDPERGEKVRVSCC